MANMKKVTRNFHCAFENNLVIAQPTIKEVESVLQTYKSSVGGVLAKISIEKAKEARTKDGSPLVCVSFFFLSSFFVLK
jgi:hypothetical protein